VALELTVM